MSPSSPEIKWPFKLITPPAQAVNFIGEEIKIGALTKTGFGALETSRPILLLAGAAFTRLGNKQGVAAVKKVLAEQPFNETWARKERERGFLTINRHMLIAIWSAVEVALEDTFIELIVNDPAALLGLKAKGLSLKMGIAEPLTESEARRCISRALQLFENQSFSGRISEVFASIGLPLALSAADGAVLDEANSVRNVLLHRGGLVDAAAVKQAPSLQAHLGKAFVVSEAFLLKAHSSISKLAVNLLTAVGNYVKSVVSTGKKSEPS